MRPRSMSSIAYRFSPARSASCCCVSPSSSRPCRHVICGRRRNHTETYAFKQAENDECMQKIPNCTVFSGLRIDADKSAGYAPPVFTRGDVLRKWREQKGWKAETLVERTGLDKNTISRAEGNAPGMRENTIARIVKALGYSMADLYSAVARYGDGDGASPDLVRLIAIASRLPDEVLGVVLEQATEQAKLVGVAPPLDRSSESRTGKKAAGNTRSRGARHQ